MNHVPRRLCATLLDTCQYIGYTFRPDFHCSWTCNSQVDTLIHPTSLPFLRGTLATHSAILMHEQPGRARESTPYRASLDQERMGASGRIWGSRCLLFTWFSVLTSELRYSGLYSSGQLPNTTSV